MLDASHRADPFDPDSIDDPLAQQTSWDPAAPGGTNIQSHRLQRTSDTRVSFVATGSARAFSVGFFLIGAFVTLLGIAGVVAADASMTPLILIGLAFAAFGTLSWRSMATPRTFDRELGAYWRGAGTPTDIEHAPDHVSLEEIHALQIITERLSIRTKHGTRRFTSHELNLVLLDGHRVNVTDHVHGAALRADAAALADFLGGVPVWDASA